MQLLSSCRGHAQPQGAEGRLGGKRALLQEQTGSFSSLPVSILHAPKAAAKDCSHATELWPSAIRKMISVLLKSSHRTKHFCWAVSGILGLVEMLQERGRTGEGTCALHCEVKGMLCSTTEGSAVRHFSDGATLNFPEGANLILCKQNHPLDCPLKAVWVFYSEELSEEQTQWAARTQAPYLG